VVTLESKACARIAAGCLVAVLVLAGCARGGGVVKPGAASDQPGGSTPDWNNPLASLGVVVVDAAAAAPLLPFSPVTPSSKMGVPIKVVTTDPHRIDQSERSIVWLFNDPAGGVFWVAEGLTQVSQSQLEKEATGCDHSSGCEGEWSVTHIRNGVTALLISGPTATSVTWLDDGVRYDVLGPAQTFSPDDAVAEANDV
jgi:hypothetical protein